MNQFHGKWTDWFCAIGCLNFSFVFLLLFSRPYVFVHLLLA